LCSGDDRGFKIFFERFQAVLVFIKLIALRIYERILKIVQWQSGQQELKTFNLKMEEYNVTDIVFLQNTGISKIEACFNTEFFSQANNFLSLPR
jgi:hypothetical protein